MGIISYLMAKIVPFLARAIEKTKDQSIIFILFVDKFEPYKISDDNFVSNKNFTINYSIKIFVQIKGNNSYKRTYYFKIKWEMC